MSPCYWHDRARPMPHPCKFEGSSMVSFHQSILGRLRSSLRSFQSWRQWSRCESLSSNFGWLANYHSDLLINHNQLSFTLKTSTLYAPLNKHNRRVWTRYQLMDERPSFSDSLTSLRLMETYYYSAHLKRWLKRRLKYGQKDAMDIQLGEFDCCV